MCLCVCVCVCLWIYTRQRRPGCHYPKVVNLRAISGRTKLCLNNFPWRRTTGRTPVSSLPDGPRVNGRSIVAVYVLCKHSCNGSFIFHFKTFWCSRRAEGMAKIVFLIMYVTSESRSYSLKTWAFACSREKNQTETLELKLVSLIHYAQSIRRWRCDS